MPIPTPSEFGRTTKLKRLFGGDSGRALVIAWAHGPLLGPGQGFGRSEMQATADAISGADALLVTPLMMPYLEPLLSQRERPSIYLLETWQSFHRRGYADGGTATMQTVEQAAAYGADGVMTYLFTDRDSATAEAENVDRIARVTSECHSAGLLHIVESDTVQREGTSEEITQRFAFHTRLAAELGADIVKSPWPGPEAFEIVREGCPVPLLVAGGPPVLSIEEMYDDVRQMLTLGADGLVYGRYVFGNPDPAGVVDSLMELVHERDRT